MLTRRVQMKMEDKCLLDRYGQAFRDYSARVKSIIPYVY